MEARSATAFVVGHLLRGLTRFPPTPTLPPRLVPHPRDESQFTQEEGTMKLLTAELRSQLPPLYSQEKNPDATVHLKFFCPWNNWTWFATEGEAEEDDFRFFG